MNIPQTYDYLMRARRELWAGLRAVPDEALSRPLLDGERFHCIKDLLLHIPEVEDGWLHLDILKAPFVQDAFPALQGQPSYQDFALETLLDYWQAVEQDTLKYLSTLSEAELARKVTDEDFPNREFSVDGLLWHVMVHEMRHTAQIAVLLRLQGIKPPALDLLWYLP